MCILHTDSPSLKRLARETLEGQAFQQLRHAIRSGELRPGQRLVESDIAARMGVSRIPIREAIRSLERDGLVVAERGRGAHVITLSNADVQEIYGLRAALEVYAVELLIAGDRAAAADALGECVTEMLRPAERHSRDELMQIDLRFHETICELSGNRRLLEAWRRLSDQIRVLLQLKDLVADDSGRLPAGHQGIVDAIRRGDAATCGDVLRTHIRRSAEQVLSAAPRPPAW